MDKAAVYELEKKGSGPLFGEYYYDWLDRSIMEQEPGAFDDGDEEAEFDLEKLQELHMFNR